MSEPEPRTEPIELTRLRRLASNPAIATLSDEHLAAIKWAVDRLAGGEQEYRVVIRYPHGQWQSWPVADEAAAMAEMEEASGRAAPDVEVSVCRRRIGPWETVKAAMGRKGKQEPMTR